MKPCIKWVGGKRKLVKIIQANLPATPFNKYYEPFLGGGAIMLSLQPKSAVVSDLNEDLINMYVQVRDNLPAVVIGLKSLENSEEQYYKTRASSPVDNIERAIRFIYLSKAGFNGLYRVNKKGGFNVPYGKYKNLSYDFENMEEVSRYLANSDIQLKSQDYKKTLESVGKGDFVFLDPPYYGTFTGYTSGGFNQKEDFEDLKKIFDGCVAKGAYVMMTNAAHPDVISTFSEYNILSVDIAWTISRNSKDRQKKANEILVTSY